MAKTCQVCGKRAYSDYCVQHKPRKPIPQQGKHAKKWQDTRKQWFRENPAKQYVCYLCGKLLNKEETTLDHIKPRSGNPELRYEFSNLKPCCWSCNASKGSKRL